MLNKVVIFLWVLFCASLFLYSFTQVDLGLTLTRASIATDIQRSFQYIGYFNRPLSTYLFIGITLLGYCSYLAILYLVNSKRISFSAVQKLVIFSGIALVFSYNAFSYDFFNYIFDAKIVTEYAQNPYVKKALDFPGDPMLSFMHWTHRTYPYGPFWLVLTIPLSFLSLGYFALNFVLFKLLALLSYFICAFFIYKIAKVSKLVSPLLALSFFAFNPFVLIEGVVSAHIDLPMMALALCGVYLLFIQKRYTSWFVILCSAGVKFATVFLAPLFVWYSFSKHKHKEYIFVILSLLLMGAGVILQAYRTNFQPWYFLLVVPFAALLSNRYYIFIPTILFSFLVLFQYVPFLYAGNFDPPIPFVLSQMLFASLGISVCAGVIYGIYKKMHS